jgi:hypothetical protein
MKRALPLLLAAGVGAGCIPDSTEYSEATPTAKQVTIPVPGANGTTSAASNGLGSSSYALLGAPSEYYAFTYTVSVGVNTGTIALIDMVKAIVEQKPTSATATSRTWGPYTPGGLDPLTYRMLVTKVAPGQFTFSLDARLKSSTSDADYQAFLDGMMTKGSAPDTGQGTMTLHFDNRRTLVPSACEEGSIAFAFDNTGSPATNNVMFAQFANNNPANPACKSDTPTDATYKFDQDSTGAGDFVFAFAANVNKPSENKPALENVSIRSRWQASGAGRSDFQISGGDVAVDLMALNITPDYVTASQCWGAAFTTVYETSSPAQLNLVATDGDATQCAFTSAMLP